MKLATLVGLVGASLMGATADPFSNIIGGLRVFDNPKAIQALSRRCDSSINRFERCINGEEASEPTWNFIGKKLLKKTRIMMDRMRSHPNVQYIVQIAKEIERDCYSGCSATPEATVDCLLDSAINGDPWNDVTQCMKAEFGVNVDLSVPELGSIEETKEDLRMFMRVAVYRYWDEKGKDAFWAKTGGQLGIICGAAKQSAMTCVENKMAGVDKDLDVDVSTLVKKYSGSGRTYGGRPSQGQLTLLGDEPARKFVKEKLFLMRVKGCTFNFIRSRGMGTLAMQGECGYAGFPKCLHYMWTMKDGICRCRTRTTSDPSIDPFDPAQLQNYVQQAQRDYINSVKKSSWQCRLTGADASKCSQCPALGRAMEAAFARDSSLRADFADSFKDEIDIIMNMLKELCRMGVTGNGAPKTYQRSDTCESEARVFQQSLLEKEKRMDERRRNRGFKD